MEFRDSTKTLQSTRQEIVRLTFATLALLIAGLMATPAMEKSRAVPNAQAERTAGKTKKKKPGATRAIAQLSPRRQ